MMRIAGFGFASGFGPGMAEVRPRDLPFRRRRDFIGADWKPQLCAFQKNAPLDDRHARLCALLDQALDDLGPVTDVTVLLGLPRGTAPAITPFVNRRLPSPQTFADGQGGVARLLDHAAGLVTQGLRVLACFADSHADRDHLGALLAAKSLFSKATPYGLIPGEAAGAILLTPGDGGPRIISTAQANEPDPESSGRDSAFTGLSSAAFDALTGISDPIRIASDWNNSRFRAAELSYCMTRLTPFHTFAAPDPIYPCATFGDCGTAWPAITLATLLSADLQGTTLALSGDTQCKRSAILWDVSRQNSLA